MKVCTVCNEIVSSSQGCGRSDCPSRKGPPITPLPKPQPGFTGRADRTVQVSLDKAGDVARDATRRAAFIVTVVFALVVAIAALGFNLVGRSDDTESLTLSVTGEANVRNAPTAEGSLVVDTVPVGTELIGRWVKGSTNPTERWFEFERNGSKGYVWERNLSSGALKAEPVVTEVAAKPAPEAMAFVGQYPSTFIQGFSIFDAPDLRSTVKAMPNGAKIWSDISKIRGSLSVETPIKIGNPGPYQYISIFLCEQHNCGGAGSRQLLIEYFPSSNAKERQAFVCLKSAASRAVYDPWGEGFMEGDECSEGGFFYGD